MVKPQFEVGRERVGAGGVVRDPALRAEAVLDVAAAAAELGLGVAGVAAARCPGRRQRRVLPVAAPGRAAGRRGACAPWSRPDAARVGRRRRHERARSALLVTHTGRRHSTEHARTVAARPDRGRLRGAGGRRGGRRPRPARRACRSPGPAPPTGVEIVFALGGDGTLLRAAELARPAKAPLLGINLGKVGFLAEAEVGDLDAGRARRRRARRTRWTSGSPSTCAPSTTARLVAESWALNEVSVEKGAAGAMLELLVDVDGRPLSRYGCDGVVVRHADRLDGVRVLGRRPGGVAGGRGAAAGADQRARAVQPAAGDRADLDVRRSPSTRTRRSRCCAATAGASSTCRRARGSRCGAATLPVRVVRLRAAAVHRPAGGEVRPAGGGLAGQPALTTAARWSSVAPRRLLSGCCAGGAAHHRARRHRRRDAAARPAGMNVITGETGAGKTMVVTGLGLLFGGRADAGRVRADPGRAVVEGRLRLAGPARRRGPGARRRRRRRARRRRHLLLSRTVTAEGRSRAHVGGRSRAGRDARRGRRAGGRRARPVRPAAAAAPGRAARRARPVRRRRSTRSCSTRYREAYAQLARGSPTTWPTGGATRASAHQEADLLRLGLDEITRVDPQPGEDDDAARPRRSGSSTPRACAPRRSWPTRRSPAAATATTRRPTRPSLLGTARRTLEGAVRRRPGAGRAGRPARRGGHPGRRRRRRAVGATSTRSTPTRPGCRRSTSAGPRCAALTRKYADDVDGVHRLGRPRPDPAGRAGHLRRAARRARPRSGSGWPARWPSWPAGCPRPGAEAAGRFADAVTRRAGRAGHAARPGRGRGAAAAGRRGEPTLTVDGVEVRRRPRRRRRGRAAAAGRTPARRRCRCRRAPPAASCPG